jgi:hypothetical protein
LPNGSVLTITAPADLALSTDPWLDVASNVSLGTATASNDRGSNDFTITNNAPATFRSVPLKLPGKPPMPMAMLPALFRK